MPRRWAEKTGREDRREPRCQFQCNLFRQVRDIARRSVKYQDRRSRDRRRARGVPSRRALISRRRNMARPMMNAKQTTSGGVSAARSSHIAPPSGNPPRPVLPPGLYRHVRNADAHFTAPVRGATACGCCPRCWALPAPGRETRPRPRHRNAIAPSTPLRPRAYR